MSLFTIMKDELGMADIGIGSSSKDGKSVICTNLPPECNEQIMSALYSQYVPLKLSCPYIQLTVRYPGFSRASPFPSSRSVPSSHPTPNPGAKSFVITFDSAEQAQGAVSETKAYLMQPGWEMGVSVDK